MEVIQMEYLWPITGVCSVVIVLLNLFRSLTGRMKHWYLFYSLSFIFPILFLLSEYYLIVRLVNHDDFGTIADVAPTMFTIIMGCCLVAFILNGISLYFYVKHYNLRESYS